MITQNSNQTKLQKLNAEKVVFIFLGFNLMTICRRSSKEIFINEEQVDQTQLGVEVYDIFSKVLAVLDGQPKEAIDDLHFEYSYTEDEIIKCLRMVIRKTKEQLKAKKITSSERVFEYFKYAVDKIGNQNEKAKENQT